MEHMGGRHRITEMRPQSNSGMYDPGQQSHSSGKKVNRTTTPRAGFGRESSVGIHQSQMTYPYTADAGVAKERDIVMPHQRQSAFGRKGI